MKRPVFWAAVSAFVMIALPWLFRSLILGYTYFTAIFSLVYVLNPIFSAVVGVFAGRDMKALWYLLLLPPLFFLAGICTLLANLLFVKAGSYIDSTLVSILAALEVVVGSLVGFLVYKEELTLVQSVGCIVIVIGVLLPNLTVLFKRRLAARHASVK